ncbi:hypothetical protein [Paenibacillus sp. Soil522]|uniref:hypothetical protein n=1 Tax=Paenibacillus sp. Soil522 TaxID=1736388 RepID=UPI0006F63536|nr:hypothetical protein [Paenibacillus sp. Soil522]KRE38171.1 hypothetical protein ASG81_20065 [Paenibacillus sp. Soil522]
MKIYGILRGALDCRGRRINEPMKRAAARAIASVISEKELNEQDQLVRVVQTASESASCAVS